MPIKIAQAFKRDSGFPIDESMMLTSAEMFAVEDSEMPSVYMAVNSDDGKIYVYDKRNTHSTTTGKFRIVEGGSGTSDHTRLINRDSVNQHPIDAIEGLTEALNDKQDSLTAGDNITIENNTISADDEVLVAVYEQTSYEDIKTAIDAHKAIVLDMPANNNQFCITFATYTNGGNALMYAIYKMSDKPTLMAVTLTPQNQWTVSHTDLQDKLVSGTNIKTINDTSLLGSGNIDIQSGGEYTAGNGIDITNDEISIDDNIVVTKTDIDTTLLKYWTLTSGKQNSLTALTVAEVNHILNT